MKKRMLQVNELVKRELAEPIHELIPQDMGLVTVIDVYVAKDLRNAIVYISVLDETRSEDILRLLATNEKELRERLALRVKLKNLPRLEFKIDSGRDNIDRVEKALKEIEK